MSDKKLTNKQEMFCMEYVVDFNATQAAIKAGYSENSAQEIGSENLSKPMIQARVQELMKDRIEKVQITAEDVIKDIIETRSETKEEKRYSERLKANELLGKYLAMWTDTVNNNNTNSGTQTIYIEREDKEELESHISDIVDDVDADKTS